MIIPTTKESIVAIRLIILIRVDIPNIFNGICKFNTTIVCGTTAHIEIPIR